MAILSHCLSFFNHPIRRQTRLAADLAPFSRTRGANRNCPVLPFALCVEWEQVDGRAPVPVPALTHSSTFLLCVAELLARRPGHLPIRTAAGGEASWAPLTASIAPELRGQRRLCGCPAMGPGAELLARFLEFRERRQRPSRKRGVLCAGGSLLCHFFLRSFAKHRVTMSHEFTLGAMSEPILGCPKAEQNLPKRRKENAIAFVHALEANPTRNMPRVELGWVFGLFP